MIKVFDYWEPNKGWVAFNSYEAAKKHINSTLHDYWLMDKDNCCECFMEIFVDGKYEVWCGEMGSWLGCGEDSPHFGVHYGTREDYSYHKFTTLHPLKDYILI